MRGHWHEGCMLYGSQFERREEIREETPFRFSPLFMRLRRHTFFRRGFPFPY